MSLLNWKYICLSPFLSRNTVSQVHKIWKSIVQTSPNSHIYHPSFTQSFLIYSFSFLGCPVAYKCLPIQIACWSHVYFKCRERVPRTQMAHIIHSPDTVQRELGTHFQNHCFCWGERNTFYLKHKRIGFLYLPKRVGWRVGFISMLNRIQSKLWSKKTLSSCCHFSFIYSFSLFIH